MSTIPTSRWISRRSQAFDSSGIRKVFDLAAQLADPVNLSIGQPDFDLPEAVKAAGIEAITSGKNGYTPSQGIPVLRNKLRDEIAARHGQADRDVFISSGTSGGLVLAMLSLVDPGDEVILFDPYFVMYPPLVQLVGGTPVVIDTYPDFRIDLDRVEAAITERTKLIVFNTPSNPTGVAATREEIEGLAELTGRRGIALISDEIYSQFAYGPPTPAAADLNPRTIVIDGFSKSHAMTGWRVGWVHGPREVIETMIKIQQYTFVCAPQPAQWAGVAAMDVDMAAHRADYRRKRDSVVDALKSHYEFAEPEGAFYLFPRAPWGTGTEFVKKAIENELLLIPGNIFSTRDTHFRLSYAAPDRTIERGIEILLKLARG